MELCYKIITNFFFAFREERKSFIRAKYIDKSYIEQYCSSAKELYSEMEQENRCIRTQYCSLLILFSLLSIYPKAFISFIPLKYNSNYYIYQAEIIENGHLGIELVDIWTIKKWAMTDLMYLLWLLGYRHPQPLWSTASDGRGRSSRSRSYWQPTQ